MTDIGQFAAQHVEAFNSASETADYGSFLAGFADDAVMRFENVPGAGSLEFRGRSAYTAAYDQNPPDDQIDIAGAVTEEGPAIIIPFIWRRDGGRGQMRLTVSGGVITEMTVAFG